VNGLSAPDHSALLRIIDAKLYVLVDGQSSGAAFATLARSLVDAGVHVLQLRDKSLCDRELLERARTLRRLTRPAGTLMIMNDRADLAVLADADGAHLGQEDLSVKDARAIVGPDRLIGVSTHSLEQARQAVVDGANYIGCGPTFPSKTKTFASFPGADFLRDIGSEITLPAFAIGGITLENLSQVIEAGFTRVAVSSAVTRAVDPGGQVRQLLARLEEASRK
jgi:thiamine-phosphate pyrophosphorylase